MASKQELKVVITRYHKKPTLDEQTGYSTDSGACRAFEQRAARYRNSGLKVFDVSQNKFLTYNTDTEELLLVEIVPDKHRREIYCNDGGFQSHELQMKLIDIMNECEDIGISAGIATHGQSIYKHRRGCRCRNKGGRP